MMPPFNIRSRIAAACVLLFIAIATILHAAPFARIISFTQPDGTTIQLSGKGDEFYAHFETLDGYTVVFDHGLKAYVFATLSPDGKTLLSTGAQVHQSSPESLGLSPHLEISSDARREQVKKRYARWDSALKISQRWQLQKSAMRSSSQKSPPSFTTTGVKVGLCLLVDFDDDPATVPQAEVISFCNGDSYGGFGNNGSVKKYYQDVSAGLLTYSNVVTIYIRIPNSLHPKSYYNDTTQDCGHQGNLLIRDALDVLKGMTNYDTEILPAFDSLTVDGSSQVVACNVFYAGDNGGVWSFGLWPHSYALVEVGAQELSPGGKQVWRYQITNIGQTLELGTFCHENGHMLCGYPDLYDYDYDSYGGAGDFCLMSYGNEAHNPVQICAYLKRASGWTTTTELDSSSSLVATLDTTVGSPGFNHFYRYEKPGEPTEYFIVEERNAAGRDATLPASGVAIWHIDELGDRDNQSLAPNSYHANYEVTLVQADNLWDFQNLVNIGDDQDLYHSGNTANGYANIFDDFSGPAANWWDGTTSGVSFHDFTARASKMGFLVGAANVAPEILFQPSNQLASIGGNASFTVSALGQGPLAYQWMFNGGDISGATNSTLNLANVAATNGGTYSVRVSNTYGPTTSSNAVLTAVLVSTVSFTNSSSITIPDSGAAAPYPSSITVSGITTPVVKVTASLAGLSHTYPDDLNILLVGPAGQKTLLMSDAGGDSAVVNIDLTFDDAGPVPPDDGPLSSGTYQPWNYPPSDLFSSPAPLGPYDSSMGVFNGVNPNGTWNLFVFDDAPGDSGSILNGWRLQFSVLAADEVITMHASINSTNVQLRFATVAGHSYTVQYKNVLSEATWHTLQSVNGDGTEQLLPDSIAPGSQRFYRVRRDSP